MAQPVDEGQAFFAKRSQAAQARRVDHDAQHAVEHSTAAIGLAVPGATTAQCAAEQLARHGHAKAFVLAKGAQGPHASARLRHHHHAGVVGGLTVFVDQGARFDAAPFVVGHAHLALGHAAGGKVEHKGLAHLVVQAQGDANAAGVGAKAPIAATKGRHIRAR